MIKAACIFDRWVFQDKRAAKEAYYALFPNVSPTLRQDPADAQVMSHKLMVRAGYIRKVAAGIYNYLLMGWRVLRKVENIIQEEMNRAEEHKEMLMPAVRPSDLWESSGRWQQYGAELLRLKDRKRADFCIGPTHERGDYRIGSR